MPQLTPFIPNYALPDGWSIQLFTKRDSSSFDLATTTTLSRLATSLFLYYDALIWLKARKLLSTRSEDKDYTTSYNQWWLAAICTNLARDAYEIRRVLRDRSKAEGILDDHNKPLAIHALINACDFFIPASNLGIVKVPASFVGLCGVVSSLCGLVTIVNPALKLAPA